MGIVERIYQKRKTTNVWLRVYGVSAMGKLKNKFGSKYVRK